MSTTILFIEDDPAKLLLWQKELAPLTNENITILSTTTAQTQTQILNRISENSHQLALIICGQPKDQSKALSLIGKLQQLSMSEGLRIVLVDCEVDTDFLIKAINLGHNAYCLKSSWQKGELCHAAKQQLQLSEYRMQINPPVTILENAPPDINIINTLADFYQETHLTCPDEKLSQQLVIELQDYFHKNTDKQAFFTYEANTIFTQEGTANDFLWFVIEGEITLLKKDIVGDTYEIASLGKGSLIGSMSFISGDVSFSTTMARTQTQVIKVDRVTFNQLLSSKHSLLPLFTRYLLRHFNRRLRSSIKTEARLQQTLKSLEAAHNELINKEKMAILGQLVAGVAHELNNPISAILSNTENLKSIIPSLINQPLTEITRYKAKQIMAYALLSNPISTIEIRAKCNSIANKISNTNVARKIVNMGLEGELDKWTDLLGKDFEDALIKWEKFYQAGNLLRSNQVCAKRIAEMVKSLKGYARQDAKITQLINLHEGIEDTLTMFENRIKKVDFIKDYADLPPIHCRPIELQQVWTNLITNALDAIENKGEIRISTRKFQYLCQDSIEVTIKDNGTGIPYEQQQKIFELNFTTKREGHFGLGIGLSICKQIVEDHKGIIEVRSEPNKYTAISVILPYQTAITASFEQGESNE